MAIEIGIRNVKIEPYDSRKSGFRKKEMWNFSQKLVHKMKFLCSPKKSSVFVILVQEKCASINYHRPIFNEEDKLKEEDVNIIC